MTVSEKIKTVEKEIEQNKTQDDLDRQAAQEMLVNMNF